MVAMHVTATNPDVLSPSDITDAVVAKEKEIQLELMKNDLKNTGKSEEIMLKIIEGKMTKFREENALLTQQFVVNPDQKVQDFIGADAIVSFKRCSI
jgi:elongation factor Ts